MKKLMLVTAASTLMLSAAVADKHKPQHARKHAHQAHKAEMAKLQDQVHALMSRIEQLEQKPVLTTETGVADSNNLKLKISGQVNRAALWVDNGKNSHVQHVDNANAPTVLNLTATGNLNADVTVGGEIEVDLKQNSSSDADVRNSNNSAATFTARKADVFMASKRFGKLAWGRGSMPSHMTMEATDLSNTEVAANGASIADMAGGAVFVNKNTSTKMNTSQIAGNAERRRLIGGDRGKVNINAVFGGLNATGVDGLGYQDRIMYQTPSFKGLTLSAGHAYASPSDGRGNDLWDTALKYAGCWNKIKLAAQVAYARNNTVTVDTDGFGANSAAANIYEHNTGYHQVNGSVGVLFPVGISLQVAGTHRDWDYKRARDAHHYSAKLGYQHKFMECGITAFAVDFGRYENFVVDGTNDNTAHNEYRGDTMGAFIVQHLDRIASEVYLGWRRHSLKIKGTTTAKAHDIDAAMFGMRVKF